MNELNEKFKEIMNKYDITEYTLNKSIEFED